MQIPCFIIFLQKGMELILSLHINAMQHYGKKFHKLREEHKEGREKERTYCNGTSGL